MFECNSCRLAMGGDGFTTIAAGEVAVDLAVCGYETDSARLPQMRAADQNYSAGLCPGMSLEKGTMFPELISEY